MQKNKSFKFEFVALMASLMSVVSLSIDALLPALPDIEKSLSITNGSETRLLVTMIFLGLGFGQLIFGSYFFSWHSIFYFNLIFAIVVMVWFLLRQPETLPKHRRIKFSKFLFTNGVKIFFKNKQALAFTLVSGFITGSFMVYLSTSQQIFQEQYNLAKMFPYIFASLAFSIGIATFINSKLVEAYGMLNISFVAVIAYASISVLYVILFYSGQNPSIGVLMLFLALQFFSVGFLFGNLRALAMEPLGNIAGIGAAINGFLSTVLAVPIANYIGGFVKTSALPLFLGFSAFGILSVITFTYFRKG